MLRFFTTCIPPKGAYQPHIDGLRALAVLAVVAYHLFKAHGAFIGVDVFFVISGYLITGLLLDDFQSHDFRTTIIDFYQRRVRRIFPAVALVLGFSLLVGWLAMFPSELAALGKHSVAAAGFVENWVLWLDAGYFDAEAIDKPLLHFWSLAVEEQFYLAWPIVLWAILRLGWPLLPAILCIFAISFTVNVWYVDAGDANTAFYLPQSRAWELMIGAWLAAMHRRGVIWLTRAQGVQAWLGLFLIILGGLVIRPEKGFPGFWALLPTLGTALVINAGSQARMNRSLMSWNPLVWVGLISYPLYLWHWVLWSFNHQLVMNPRQNAVVVFVLSIILAWATYRWVEQPLRRNHGNMAYKLAIIVFGVGAIGGAIFSAGGCPGRPLSWLSTQSEHYLHSIQTTPLRNRCYDLKHKDELQDPWYCVIGDTQAKKWIMVYGDSHALSMIPALDHYGDTVQVKVVFAGIPACPALLGIIATQGGGKACQSMVKAASQMAVEQGAKAVLLLQRWTLYVGSPLLPDPIRQISRIDATPEKSGIDVLRYGLRATLGYYQSAGIPVVLFEDNPQQIESIEQLRTMIRFADGVTDESINRSAVSRDQYREDQQMVNQLLKSEAGNVANTRVLNIAETLCDTMRCPWVVEGKFLYTNDNHLSVTGAMRVYPLLAQHLDALLAVQPLHTTSVQGGAH